MSETGDRLRHLFEQIAPPVDVRGAMASRAAVVGLHRGWLIAGASAGAVLLLGLAGWLLAVRRGAEPPVLTGPPVTVSTIAPTTTTAPATTSTTAPSVWPGLDALSVRLAGPLPPAATCPFGSAPDQDTDSQAAGPPAAELAPAAFDRQSGVIVYGVGYETWAFDVCRNRWQLMSAGGPRFGDRASEAMVYDADSDLVVAFDGTAVWTYDFDTDTWTRLDPELPSAEGQGLYHQPSGLVIMVDAWSEAAWAYDVETGSRFELGPMPARGLLGYDPRGNEWYLYEVAKGDRPATTWRYVGGQGWIELDITTPTFMFTAGDLFSGRETAVDETTGRIFVFSGGLLAAFDPTAPAWEILSLVAPEADVLEGPGYGFPASVVWDTLAERLVVLGGWYRRGEDWAVTAAMWAFEPGTADWVELPAATG